jgi:glyoxylase I family protein
VPLAAHHLAVKVTDLARAEAFYVGVLGLAVLRRWDDEAGSPRAIWLELGAGAFLALERAESPGAPVREDGAAGWHCVALGIAPGERETWRRRLEERGVRVERESAYTLYVRDPDQNLLGLSHYPVAASTSEVQ